MNIFDIKTATKLFTGSESDIRNKYKSLSQIYHPDINKSKNANDEFIYLTKLYNDAIKLLKESKNNRLEHNTISFTENGKLYKIRYVRIHEKPLYKLIVSENSITYIISDKYKDYYDNYINYIKYISNVSFPKKKEFDKFFPKIKYNFKTDDNQYIIIINKDPEILPLIDLVNFLNNNIDGKHVAWILNSIYNIVCYLNVNNICHNNILPENIFINTKDHNCYLFGGWWYSVKLKQELKATSKEMYGLYPSITKTNKISIGIIDLEGIKYIGRYLLGDVNGTSLKYKHPDLNILVDFLRLPATNNPFDEYSIWEKNVAHIYGERKFIDMDISFKSVYGI